MLILTEVDLCLPVHNSLINMVEVVLMTLYLLACGISKQRNVIESTMNSICRLI